MEFLTASRELWSKFLTGEHVLIVSVLTLQELAGAPAEVRRHLEEVPAAHQIQVRVGAEARELADAYVAHGVVGPGSMADALHVALATVHSADVLVSWNFKHIVNLGRIRLFNAVNLEQGYGLIEIRTPREVLYEEDI
ncbi:MAG: type II toxin-antitoxin system VapC family toxin [Planctomycetes bacterium]|nr:type II toxin-antitoxin system VapC family toxin [Planctomycetota bacterium]